MAAIIEIVNIVLPVFMVLAAGFVLVRSGFVSEQANAVFSRLVFYVAAPALLFRNAALSPVKETVRPDSLLLVGAITVMVAFLVYGFCSRAAPPRRGVLAQGGHRSNMVFVGLPVIIYAFGDDVIAPAAVLIGFMVVVYNFLAVLVLILPHRAAGGRRDRIWLKTAVEVVKNPLIIASGGGILLSALGLSIPQAVDRSLELVGRIAMPLALLSVGGSLDFRRLRSEIGPAAVISFIKLVAYPGLVYIGLRLLDVPLFEQQYTVLIMAAPTAVVSCIMAREMKGDENLASAIVIGTTIASLFSISAWLAFFRFAG
jgi:predicted permease